ncbi:MAG TPA: GAF domain-containing protein [Streptosporangiaceae bacterium]|nr:GAF domain-containing protein [Streptosporangiaceae bacterium]
MGVPEVPASLRSWMSAVSEIVRSVNAAEPLASVLTRVAEQACELIGFEFCAVMLADERRECLQIAGWSGLTPDYLAQVSDGQGLRIRPPGPDLDTPAARAYREGRTIVVPDVGEARSYGRLRHLAPTQGYQALLVSPLRGSGDLAGVIVAYSVTARQFSGPELELIELLAGQAAMALETARLRAEQQDVIRELSLANEEMRRGRAVLEWAEQQHHQLMQLVLDEVELPGLVAALASALRASVTVEDTDGRVLASAPAEGYCPPPAPAARRAGAARAALKAQEASGRRYTVARVPVRGPNGRVTRSTAAWAAPVVVGGELAGRLWVTDPPAEPEPVQLRVIERFALVVALLLLQQRHLLDVQSRLSGDLLGDLLRDGGPVRPRAVLDRAAALGHDLSRPHVLALLTADAAVPSAVRLPELARAAAEPGPVPLAGPYDGAHVLLLPAEPDPGDALRRILAKADQATGARGRLTLVAGPVARDPAGYAAAFRVARGAAALRQASGRGGFVDVGRLGLSALLLETGTPDALRRFAADVLHTVAEHEERHGGDLLATLRAWLSAGCSTAAAADALVVHRNTVTYRLGRIEQLTGRSLRDSRVRLELELALTIREIVQAETPG